ncbi:kinesin-like protein KIF23 [Tribolium castaneum]|uniref:Kinesin-like protein n=1 Tax=Tribolium castaneum TaxID=7070 RepID=D6WJB3_TRICA|nr:PREDICTED: kinesin-like protein KIF23 [Tribolium castaneum]EFA04570.1 pavarotti 1 [Tribolium castaneum]|eukprot:XP_008194046.1 PREDICTED: kinesin-like protein KIF23 [Tribolium castaneum]
MNPVSKFTPKIRREKTITKTDKDPVQVFCRLRPLKGNEESTCIRLLSPTTLALTTPAESKIIRKEIHCKFKHIFTAFATQNEVFEHVAYPLLEDLLKGKNALLFTYGVTGSGKTHTLTGDHNNPGIMPKCIYTIFNSISAFQAPKCVIKSDKMNGFEVQSQDDAMQDQLALLRASSKSTPRSTVKRNGKEKTYVNDGIKIMDVNEGNLYSVFVSYIEIYNNTVYDLLDENTGSRMQGKILREDSNKNMYVNGVVETEVKSAEEAFELFNIGQKRKKMGNTILNSVSSRSHSILNIRLVQLEQYSHNAEGRPMIPDSNLLKISQLSLVDLAGSERTTRTQNTGQLLREASQINNSLMSLRTCLDVLRENQTTGGNRLVPYRDSRLTLLFKNYFEGEGRVEMIVCVNPSIADFEENLQVMKFAESTQDVKVARSEPKYTPCKSKITKKTPMKSKASLFTLGPKIPEFKRHFSSLDESHVALERLSNILKTRFEKIKSLDATLDQEEARFRKRLLEIQQENILGKSEVKSSKALLKKEKQRSYNMEAKLADAEARAGDFRAKIRDYQDEIASLRNIIAEKDLKINKNILEKEKTKQKLALQTEKMTQELDAKLRRQREHLQAAAKAKENKLQKVREILDKEITPPEIEEEQAPLEETPKQQTRRRYVGTPAATRRRSRSAGPTEVWLEHNSVKPVPLGTVLQPSMKKRKSVTKLSKASDVTNPKQSKYCLIAQEQDDGGVETRVYKGDIVPTCGGGAQVIFNDVERLRQESPTADAD